MKLLEATHTHCCCNYRFTLNLKLLHLYNPINVSELCLGGKWSEVKHESHVTAGGQEASTSTLSYVLTAFNKKSYRLLRSVWVQLSVRVYRKRDKSFSHLFNLNGSEWHFR